MYYLNLNGYATLRSLIFVAGYAHFVHPVVHWYTTLEMCVSFVVFFHYYMTVLPPETRTSHRKKLGNFCVHTGRIFIRTTAHCCRIAVTYLFNAVEYIVKLRRQKLISVSSNLRSIWIALCRLTGNMRRSKVVVRCGRATNEAIAKCRNMLRRMWRNLCHLTEPLIRLLTRARARKVPKSDTNEVDEEVQIPAVVQLVHSEPEEETRSEFSDIKVEFMPIIMKYEANPSGPESNVTAEDSEPLHAPAVQESFVADEASSFDANPVDGKAEKETNDFPPSAGEILPHDEMVEASSKIFHFKPVEDSESRNQTIAGQPVGISASGKGSLEHHLPANRVKQTKYLYFNRKIKVM